MKKVKDKIRNIYDEALIYAAMNDINEVLAKYESSLEGLTDALVLENRSKYGTNLLKTRKRSSILKRILESYFNPFTLILITLAIVSLFTDVIFSEEKSYVTIIIIVTMVFISGTLKFFQDNKSAKAASKLAKMISTTTNVKRNNVNYEIDFKNVVCGDLINLSAGDMVPADMRIISAKDLFISESSLTGESEPCEKNSNVDTEKKMVTSYTNLAFMGTNVISGSGVGVVINNGNNTVVGNIVKDLDQKPPKTTFELGIKKVSLLLIRFMIVMVPFVFIINGITKHDWLEALLFAVSIAVGLTPEMLPMIVTTNLAKGSLEMSKKNVIVKNLNSIQNLGAIDILCTDKTGTLTLDNVILERHMDVLGHDDDRVLRHAYLNSYYQTGLKNLIDIAIIDRFNEIFGLNYDNKYNKVDEIPFDFNRRRMSVVISDNTGKKQLITKGAVEEMLKISKYVEYNGKVELLNDELRALVLKQTDNLNDEGYRVIAVSQKNVTDLKTFSATDESEMVLIGYLALLDPPKPSSKSAIKALNDYGVSVKILTGDNEKVTKCVCKKVGINVIDILLGNEIETMTDEELGKKALEVNVFAKVSPSQKARIIRVLRASGHSVGYTGDGINDCNAMNEADVSISVDSAVDIAKETASVILLEKDLNVIKDGIVLGRKTYANTIKYIKMTASSNFGNMFSVLVASAFLPFLPMMSIQLILLNLIYDISCIAIPFDNVDEDYILKPRKWDASSLKRFMVFFGPISSIFDIVTFLVMFFVIAPFMVGANFSEITDINQKMLFISIFQTGWFIESMWTQTLVIHMIRTPKLPFIESRASTPVTLLTFLGIMLLTVIPFTPIAKYLGLTSLGYIYFIFLTIVVILYILLVTVLKNLYVKKYKELL